MLSYNEELSRLNGDGATATSKSADLTITLNVHCPGGAAEVLKRVKTVLGQVVSVRASGSEWPQVEAWARVLPGWFVEACQPEMSREEAQAWLEKWRSLSADEQAAEEARQPWALADWLHWFAKGPDERQWRWFSGGAAGPDRLQVVLEAEGLPTAYGALVWLLRAAGAVRVQEA